jgi:hypothetical protein
MALASEEFCPVSEILLGRLYRSSPQGISVLVRTVPPRTRAALAYYCSRRAHLDSIALVIASTCSEQDLYEEAGRAGTELFAKAQPPKLAEAMSTKSRHGISLASGELLTFTRLANQPE